MRELNQPKGRSSGKGRGGGLLCRWNPKGDGFRKSEETAAVKIERLAVEVEDGRWYL